MKLLSFFVVLTASVLYVLADDCDTKGILFYEDLGCIVKTKDGNCPSSFDCSTVENSANQCSLKGKTYAIGNSADSIVEGSSCNAGCFCRQGDGKAAFHCAILDCPEYLGVPVSKSECYRKYELGVCCAVGEICPPYEEAVCEYGGNKYKEGEQMYVDSCHQCVCQKGFSGKLEAPYCQREICGAQLTYADEVNQNCAPIYRKGQTNLCCPYRFLCPSNNDEFTDAPDDTTDQLCKFGDKEVKLGQVLKRTEEYYGSKKELECSCDIPPFLTCREINILN